MSRFFRPPQYVFALLIAFVLLEIYFARAVFSSLGGYRYGPSLDGIIVLLLFLVPVVLIYFFGALLFYFLRKKHKK